MPRRTRCSRLLASLLLAAGAAAFAQPPELGPSHRAYHAMAYDAESERVVLFGGMTGLTPGDDGKFLSQETWSYDPATGVWRELQPAETPTTSSGAAVAYDAESDRVILFGGTNAHAVSNHLIHPSETWAFDLDTAGWTKVYAMGKGP